MHLRPLLHGSRNRAISSLEQNHEKMEKICDLGRINSELQVEINTLESSIDNIKKVNSVEICWADSVVLDIVTGYLQEEVEIRLFQKEFNKKEMSNLLAQTLPK